MPFLNRSVDKLREERAFGIVEALMAMTIMSLVLIALLGLLSASVKAVTSSKTTSVATQIANERMEQVRSMPYAQVGLTTDTVESPSDPIGYLDAETQTASGTQFTITYRVKWVDETSTASTEDYKQVWVNVSWVERGTTRTVSASTFIKDKPDQYEPPTVNFDSETAADGTTFDSSHTPIPLRATGTDDENDLVLLRFYVGGITPADGIYQFDPTYSYQNSILQWDPNVTTVNTDGTTSLMWEDGTYEVVAEVWDSHGLRDSKSIFWTLDRFTPIWNPLDPENLTTQLISDSSIQLAWHSAIDGRDSVNKYNIYRKESGEALFSAVATNTAGTDYTCTGLTGWTTYEFYVKGVSPLGNEATMTGDIVSATTPFWLNGVSSKYKDHGTNYYKVDLSWQDPLSLVPQVAVDHFDIYQTVNGTETMIHTNAGDQLTYTDNNLLSNTQYRYEVRAYSSSDVLLNTSTIIYVTTPS
ncbi:MAG: fibronectin type III domain-containing protein [Candidatus Aquicultor sp.]